jgi:small subunit ribosomal protein S17
MAGQCAQMPFLCVLRMCLVRGSGLTAAACLHACVCACMQIIRSWIGHVVSDKMDKTIAVEVSQYFKHPRYRKYVKSSRKFLAHDEGQPACQHSSPRSLFSSRQSHCY